MKVVAVSTSSQTGVKKTNVDSITLVKDFGVKDDAHAGLDPKRQVSLLAIESIASMNNPALKPGDFAENITTEGIKLHEYPLGTMLSIGNDFVGRITQIGKTCHHGCAIKQEVGHCIMPKEGIFISVYKEGTVKPGDEIKIVDFC